MNGKKHKSRFYIPAIKKMRLLLMMFAILYTYGVHSDLGDVSGAVLGFSFPALYIISGYVVLRESQNTEKRILRAIGRTALCFVILAVTYFGLSLAVEPELTLELVGTKEFWMDLLILNVWSLPIGQVIWYVQALLYAYIIVFVIYKLKLLRFDIFFAFLCLAVTLISGELSSVVGFSFFGLTCLGGNFITRALPYILIGSFISRKKKYFRRLDLIHHIGIFAFGVLLSAAEYFALAFTGNKVYVGHLFGMGFEAAALCLFSFFVVGMKVRSTSLKSLSRFELAIPFFVSSPICYFLGSMISHSDSEPSFFGGFVGVITLILSFAVLYLYIFIRFMTREMIYYKNVDSGNKKTNEAGSDKQ